MTTLELLLMSSVGVWLASGLSIAPQKCFLPPCAPPPKDLPDGQPWPPRCQDQCLTDRDCGPRGLCCAGCGCKSCQQGAPIDSCLTKVCPEGTVCVDTPVFCKKAPCPQARCVQVSTKPGTCPQYRCAQPAFPTCRDQCRTDSDCNGSNKCCSSCSGCKTCQRSFGGSSGCSSSTQCPGGETCVAGSCVCNAGIVNCFVAPCQFARCDNHPNAVCSDNYCGGCHAVWREYGQIVTDCRSGISYR